MSDYRIIKRADATLDGDLLVTFVVERWSTRFSIQPGAGLWEKVDAFADLNAAGAYRNACIKADEINAKREVVG